MAANTFLQRDNPYVAANTVERCHGGPQHGSLCEEEDTSEKLHDDLQHGNLCEEANIPETLHGGPQHGNLCEEEDTPEKLHDALQRENLCEEEDNSEKLLYNQEVSETLKGGSWVAWEASRHGSWEV